MLRCDATHRVALRTALGQSDSQRIGGHRGTASLSRGLFYLVTPDQYWLFNTLNQVIRNCVPVILRAVGGGRAGIDTANKLSCQDRSLNTKPPPRVPRNQKSHRMSTWG
jgi:hypothetical protein